MLARLFLCERHMVRNTSFCTETLTHKPSSECEMMVMSWNEAPAACEGRWLAGDAEVALTLSPALTEPLRSQRQYSWCC